MDQKTEELRDIFMTVADDETVTERQEESPGTLTGEAPVDDRLDALISRMRERYRFQTDLDTVTLRSIARAFYDDRSDEEIAAEIDVEPPRIFGARVDLHLVGENDRPEGVPFEEIRRLVADGASIDDLKHRFDADEERLRRALDVVKAESEMRRASYRFRDEFDTLLGDGDVTEQLGEEVTESGLEDATEGLEVKTSF